MIADLHCHYPMHLPEAAGEAIPDPTNRPFESMVDRDRSEGANRLRARLLACAAKRLNYRSESDSWRVSFDGLRTGEMGIVFSVLYQPFDEMDFGKWPSGPPETNYFKTLWDQLVGVEKNLQRCDPGELQHKIIRTPQDLKDVRADGRTGIVHCIEGGFSLGASPDEIRENVPRLAERGVAYVTLAHLFFRKIAKNAPALPFLGDFIYNLAFWQLGGTALTDLGQAAVDAMYEERMLIDVCHMRDDAINETFDRVEALDRHHHADPRSYPVIATHAAARLSRMRSLRYNLSPRTIKRIADRGGVIGLIFAQHQLNDGRRRPEMVTIEESADALMEHIEAIHEVVGTYDNIAIGSDLDGFIRPTIGEVQNIEDLKKLREPLEKRCPGHADAILFDNAARVLETMLDTRANGPIR